MRQLRALPPALLAASALLLTACDPVGSSTAEMGTRPAPSSPAVSTVAPSPAPPEAPTATATSTPDVAEATAGGVLTVNPKPAPLVAAWARHRLYELSFVLPADPEKLWFEDDPAHDSYYAWNMGSHELQGPVGMSVESSATDGRATAPVKGLPNQESVSTLDLPGADDAWLAVYRDPAADTQTGSPSRTYLVFINTATRSYRMIIGVPLTDEGAEVAREAIASLHLTTG